MPVPPNLTAARKFVTDYRFKFPMASGPGTQLGPPLGEPVVERSGDGAPGSWLMDYNAIRASLTPLPADSTKAIVTFTINNQHAQEIKNIGQIVQSFII